MRRTAMPSISFIFRYFHSGIHSNSARLKAIVNSQDFSSHS